MEKSFTKIDLACPSNLSKAKFKSKIFGFFYSKSVKNTQGSIGISSLPRRTPIHTGNSRYCYVYAKRITEEPQKIRVSPKNLLLRKTISCSILTPDRLGDISAIVGSGKLPKMTKIFFLEYVNVIHRWKAHPEGV